MTSPAWLPHEVQPSTSNASISGPPAGRPSAGSLAPIVVSASDSGTTVSKASSSSTTDSINESSQAKSVNAPGYVLPASSFSYNVLPNSNTVAGGSQHSASSVSASLLHFLHLLDGYISNLNQLIDVLFIFSEMQAINPNQLVSPAVMEFPGSASSAGSSFSYMSQTVGFSPNQKFQSNTVRVDS